MRHTNLQNWFVFVSMSLCLTNTTWGARPPKPEPKKESVDDRPTTHVKLKVGSDFRLSLEKDIVIGRQMITKQGRYSVVQAVDVSSLDQTQRRDTAMIIGRSKPPTDATKQKSPFAVWLKQFGDNDLKVTNGYASVVDENVFTDLKLVSGSGAKRLDLDGFVIGRVKLKEYDPVELTKFLVATGIVSANMHILATVTGDHFISEQGHWFNLHSSDPYWTNKSNHASYKFALHYAKDGTIRLVNPMHVGRLLKQTEK